MTQVCFAMPTRSAKAYRHRAWQGLPACTCLLMALCILACIPESVSAEEHILVRLKAIEGKVFVQHGIQGSSNSVVEGQVLRTGDVVSTGEYAKATLVLADKSKVKLPELTVLHLRAPRQAQIPLLHLLQGGLFIFNREAPDALEWLAGHANGAAKGTEFMLMLDTNRTVVAVFEGTVDLVATNTPSKKYQLTAGEIGLATPAGQFQREPILSTNLVQWWLFYPAVLDDQELKPERESLAKAAAAYRAGNPSRALALWPDHGLEPKDPTERILLAGAFQSIGRVDRAARLLETLPPTNSFVNALSLVQDAVRRVVRTNAADLASATNTASECLGLSYYLQSRRDLSGARTAARLAVNLSPLLGHARVRLAELEFSFGNIAAAQRELTVGLAKSPENPQGHALQGFLLAAASRLTQATREFEKAIELDSGLGNAWLGRGLCRIRQGDLDGGLADLRMAVVQEENRSFLRSYLAEGLGLAANERPGPAAHAQLAQAKLELTRAKELDPHDPTPLLYSALLNYQQNRVNRGIADLEASQAKTGNRAVYRHGLLLDQDRAVRSAGLATIYQRAGMSEAAVREASKAVSYDYANHSAHLFLAESYNALRDPARFNLRYETAWSTEQLLADLLAPPGAGVLSRNITQQEYSRLFDMNGPRFSADSQLRSDGQIRETASYSHIGNRTSFAVDVDYEHNQNTGRLNNDLSRKEFYGKFKLQLSAQDSLFALVELQALDSGDNFARLDPAQTRPDLRLTERQVPNLAVAWHREWNQGMHTLLLGGRLVADQLIVDRAVPQTILVKNGLGQVTGAARVNMDVDQRVRFEALAGEFSQIFQFERHTLVAGTRVQQGQFASQARLTNPGSISGAFSSPPADAAFTEDFWRASGYGYYSWKVSDSLVLIGGLSYDHLRFPQNFRDWPLQPGETGRSRFNQKAGVVWNPARELTFRSAFTRSQGGVVLDESFRLEPTQVAGFNQAFRTLMPEAVAGSVSGPTFDTLGAGLDVRLCGQTYLTLEGEWLRSKVDRALGVFDFVAAPAVPSTTPEHREYDERVLTLAVNQLVDEHWTFNARFQWSRSKMETFHSEVPTTVEAPRVEAADLKQAGFQLIYHGFSGFFSRAELRWFWQHSAGYTPGSQELVSEAFPQLDLLTGWRDRRRGEVSLGVLNLTGADYRLNPLSYYGSLPRDRVFVARLKIAF